MADVDLIRALKTRREQHGLSQKALANVCGLDQTHISRLENRTTLPTLGALRQWAAALGFDVDVQLVDRGEADRG